MYEKSFRSLLKVKSVSAHRKLWHQPFPFGKRIWKRLFWQPEGVGEERYFLH